MTDSKDNKPSALTATIHCAIQRNYGVETVTFGISYNMPLSSVSERQAAYTEAYRRMDDEHKAYAERILPGYEAPATSGNGSGGGEWVIARRIVKEMKAGKVGFAVQGGKYEKHGVRVWEETLVKFGFWDDVKNADITPLDNLEMLVYNDGKGVKVTEFREMKHGT